MISAPGIPEPAHHSNSEPPSRATSSDSSPSERTQHGPIELVTLPKPVTFTEDKKSWSQRWRSCGRSTEPKPPKQKKVWPTDWRAYTTLLGGFLLMFNSWGIVNAFGTFLSFYQEVLLPNSRLEVFNLIGSTQSFVVLSLSFIIGRLLDAGFHLPLRIIGTVLTCLGLFLLSVVNGGGMQGEGSAVLDWVVQGLVCGLGMACFFVTSSQVVATWFQDRKGFAIGVVATGASIAGLIYPIMLRFLIDSYGFNTAVRYITLLCFLTCLLSIFLIQPNPEHKLRPLSLRQSPDYTPPPSRLPSIAEHPTTTSSSSSSTISAPQPSTSSPSPILALKTWLDPVALRHPSFLLFTAAISMMFFGFYGVFFNLEEWAAQRRVGFKGATPPPCPADQPDCVTPGLRTYWLLAIMNASSSVGRLSSSYLCDRFGALKVHSSVTIVSGVLCVALWSTARNLSGAIAFVVLFGAFSGSVIGLPPASMAAILGPGKEEQARLGQWVGMMYTVAAPFALTGPVIEGYFIQRYGYNFFTIQFFSGGCLLFSGALMMLALLVSKGERAERVLREIRRGRDKVRERKERMGSVVSTMGSTVGSRASSLFKGRKEEV
ncbi:MFS transporter-like protein 163 [Elsinoe australis]|uniref:MFS transporter-like protein 163 n=1 Tax=Elsinoe australis TaxID=40998 RepID=A0A4U7AV35_9PEZI|nr:MFS transporter-like protein 163 [Elsinoe australis]